MESCQQCGNTPVLAGSARVKHATYHHGGAKRADRGAKCAATRGEAGRVCDAMHVRSLYTDLAQGGAARTGRLCVASARAEGTRHLYYE